MHFLTCYITYFAQTNRLLDNKLTAAAISNMVSTHNIFRIVKCWYEYFCIAFHNNLVAWTNMYSLIYALEMY